MVAERKLDGYGTTMEVWKFGRNGSCLLVSRKKGLAGKMQVHDSISCPYSVGYQELANKSVQKKQTAVTYRQLSDRASIGVIGRQACGANVVMQLLSESSC